MKVSILMITYNHEKFIAQAIESVLAQEVDFEYELVIGEDCSPDRTREIVIDYHQKYPTKIRPLLHKKNLGGRGMNNFVTTFHACQGQYIAILEGDDYWTNPQKLQKQVNFLDSHPDVAICFHNVRTFYQDGSQEPHNLRPANQKEISTLEDLFVANFIPSCSVVFRRGLVNDFPDWFYTLEMGDWPLHILNAEHGKTWAEGGNIGYINEVMATYRIHRGGVWSSESKQRRLHAYLEMFEQLNPYFDYKYDRHIRASISKYSLDLACVYAECGEMTKAERYLLKSLIEYPFNSRIRWQDMVVMLGRVYLPTLYKLLKWPSRGLQQHKNAIQIGAIL